MKKILAIMIVSVMISCHQKEENITPDSVFHLASKWENQNGKKMKLEELKGKVTVMVMIYTSCKTACPRLTADMRTIAAQIPESDSGNIRYVLVSIDPETDTPEKMRQYLNANEFTGKEWLFLRSSEENTRELANVLAVKYKQISPMDFSHSNIVSVFSKSGSLAFQREGLSADIHGTVNEIKKQLR